MPEEIALRPLTAEDQPFLWEVFYHAIYVEPGEPPLPPDVVHLPELSRYVVDFGRPGDWGVVALAGDRPVGAAWVRLMHGYGFIDDATPELTIALLPGWRGQGLGTRLLKQLLADIAPHFAQVCLSVTWTNPARRLYERLGFEEFSREGDSGTMLKRLP